jgi:RimJ/RimL family protein N-acetyltransferase
MFPFAERTPDLTASAGARAGAGPSGEGRLPRRVSVTEAGIMTWGTEELVVEPGEPEVGRAVCIASGTRLAFRRVLAVQGRQLRLRADVAPFEDRWEGEIVGLVRPRLVDKVAAIDPDRWTRANWRAAVAMAHALAARRRLKRHRQVNTTTRVLEPSEWPRVRQFWREACGNELHVDAHANQHVIALFDGPALVGANIHLVFGSTSCSTFTLVDRRYRGTGGGTKMIQRAIALAREQRLESIYVHINARNLPSLRAYRRAGFERKGWWSDDSDPLASAERQWQVFEIDLTTPR